jgi:hypothetical protein
MITWGLKRLPSVALTCSPSAAQLCPGADDLPKHGAGHAQRASIVVEAHIGDGEAGFALPAVVGEPLHKLLGPIAGRLGARVLCAPPLHDLARAARLVKPCVAERSAMVRRRNGQRQNHGREEVARRKAHAERNGRDVLQVRIGEVVKGEIEGVGDLAMQCVCEREFAEAGVRDEKVGHGVFGCYRSDRQQGNLHLERAA